MAEVLVFMDWYLPGYRAGGPVTSCSNMIDALRDEMSFSVVTRDRDYCVEEPYKDVVPDQWVVRAPSEKVMYLSPEKLNFKTIRRVIDESEAKTIYINGVYSLKFSIWPLVHLWRRADGRKVIVSGRGMLAKSAIGVKRLKKTLFLRMARIVGLYRNVIFHATNIKERDDILREIGPQTQVVLAPNIPKRQVEIEPPKFKEVGSIRLVSIARIAPEKNLLFLLDVLSKTNASVNLEIYGSIYDESYWAQCQSAISSMPEKIQVDYKGIVEPSKISAIIQQNHMLILPSLGENFGHVVAEALIAGRPVIISDQTPWKKLESRYAGVDLPLSEHSFSEAIDRFAAMDLETFGKWVAGAADLGRELINDPEPIEAHRKLLEPNT